MCDRARRARSAGWRGQDAGSPAQRCRSDWGTHSAPWRPTKSLTNSQNIHYFKSQHCTLINTKVRYLLSEILLFMQWKRFIIWKILTIIILHWHKCNSMNGQPCHARFVTLHSKVLNADVNDKLKVFLPFMSTFWNHKIIFLAVHSRLNHQNVWLLIIWRNTPFGILSTQFLYTKLAFTTSCTLLALSMLTSLCQLMCLV